MTDAVGFPIGSQTRTLGGHTVTWVPWNPRGIGSWSAHQTASSTQYGMLRSSWRRRPRRPCGGNSNLSSAQSRSYGKRGSNTTHIGRRLADRTNVPASGGPGQYLPDLLRSGLSAPRAMKVTERTIIGNPRDSEQTSKTQPTVIRSSQM